MGYNEFIRAQTINMLNEKAERMIEEIRWLERRSRLYGEDHEYDIRVKRTTLSALRRRIAVLDAYYPP